MRALRLRFTALAAFTMALASWAGGCGGDGTVGQTFQNLGGSGGNSTGSGQGAAGGTTTGDTDTPSSAGGSTTTSETETTAAGGAGGSTATTSNTTPACNDTGAEPNESEATAKNLGTIDDCDGSGDSFSGVLNGPDDVDWFKYSGQDAFGCQVGAARSVTFMAPARICKFIECEGGGDPTYTCSAGSTGATSPAGRPGCCATDGFDVDIDCPGVDDNATVYIRVDNPNAGACIPYTVAYHY